MLAEPKWPVVIGSAIVVSLIWTTLFEINSLAAVALPIIMLASIGTGCSLWQALTLRQFTLLSLATVIFVFDVSFGAKEAGETGLDWQNGLKLLGWAALLVIAVLNIGRIATLISEDTVLLAMASYCGVCVLSSTYSMVPVMTAASSLGMIAYLGFACLVVNCGLSERQLYLCLTWTFALFCIANILSAFLAPADIAYMQVNPIVDPSLVRFQGISGQPNSLARMASMLALVAGGAAYRRYLTPIYWVPMMLMAVGLVLVTESRTSLLAILLAALFQLPRRLLLLLLVIVVVIGVVIVFGNQLDTVLGMIGREGDESEALSMSGRTDLWDFSLRQIVDRPLIGYGFNSFGSYAVKMWSENSFAAITSPHSNYLNVAFSTGLFGLTPFLVGFAVLLYRWMVDADFPRDFVVFNVLITGFTESDVLTTISPVPTLIFFLFIALDTVRRRDLRQGKEA